MEITVFTDGGSRGNPGEGAIGIIIKLKTQSSNPPAGRAGLKNKEEKIIKIGKKIGVCTNNEAEYLAVVEALKNIKYQISNIKYQKNKIQILFYLDSSLVVNQLKGLFKVKEPRMRELLMKVRELEGEIGVYPAYHLIPREENKEADKLVNQALDSL